MDATIFAFLRESGLETPLLQHRIVGAWPSVVAPEIAAHTQAIKVEAQALWVRVEVPALRTQLSMQKQSLVRALNAQVGSHVIFDLKFV